MFHRYPPPNSKLNIKMSLRSKQSKTAHSLSNSSFSASSSSVHSQPSESLRPTLGPSDATLQRLKSSTRHKEYELTYDMMLGIRTFVSMSNVNTSKTLDLHLDFREKKRLFFPSEGSSATPPHAMRSFSFTDYCPETFKRLREFFGINPADYLVDLCGDFAYLKFQTNSKSGQFFFYSHDKRYLIKTIKKEEKLVLRRCIQDYYGHVHAVHNSLLTRFVGLHAVNVRGIGKKYFIIMVSVFPAAALKVIYDLKGSSLGREAKPKDKEKETPMLKDNDARGSGFKIELGVLGKVFLETAEKDATFLRNHNIIDYSLLVGVRENYEIEEKEDENVFRKKDGGVEAKDCVLYLGIIDVLQEFNSKKKLESTVKGLIHGKEKVSVVDPDFYKKRFLRFLKELVS